MPLLFVYTNHAGLQMQLSKDVIARTRQHFVDNAFACITEVIDGRVRVNDPESYCDACEVRALQCSLGRWDHTWAFRQYATYLATGKMHALLP